MANTSMAPAFNDQDGISPVGSGKSKEPMSEGQLQDAARGVIEELDGLASTAMQRRSTTEQRWLRNLRQFHGQYDDLTRGALDGDNSRSSVFINVTRPKTNAWTARMGDMLFPNDERNYGIDPTPVPNLTDEAKAAVAEAERLDQEVSGTLDQHNAAVEAGGAPDPMLAQNAGEMAAQAKSLRDMYDETQSTLEESRDRARRMERTIDDQLTEASYPHQARLMIDDSAKLGSGVIKGPIQGGKRRPMWKLLTGASDKSMIAANESDENGQAAETWKLDERDPNAPMVRRVNPWHFFPDPDAETLEDAEYCLERHLPNKKMLRRMAKQQGFDKKAVRKLLADGPQHNTGSAQGFQYLQVLRDMENGGEGTDGSSNAYGDRYLVWEFYGTLEIEQITSMMRLMGRGEDADRFEEEGDELDEHMVRIFFCDKQLLKIEEDYLLDSQDFIYSVFPFEKSESSILGGVGVPDLMEDEQSMLNSAVRMMMDNGALASGPQVVMDKEAITPENGSWKMTPRKVWLWLSKKSGERREAPFVTVNIPLNQEQLSQIIMLAMRFIDEAVSMPLIAQGEQGQHITKTKGGMSMLFNSANVVFRRVIKNYDDAITSPLIRRFFDFNMQFSDDKSIKGDMQIEARGTSVLLVREMQAEQLLQIIGEFSTHPVIGVAIKAYEAMRLVLQAMNITPGDVLLEKDDYLEKLKAMAESEGSESADTIRAQASIEVAQIDQQTKMAVSASNEKIANVRMQTELIQLSQEKDIRLEQIAAMFKTKEIDGAVKLMTEREKVASSERKLASEVAVEQQNAREARAVGMNPTGSGGSISLGAEQ